VSRDFPTVPSNLLTIYAGDLQHYNFGDSETVKKKEFSERIHQLLAKLRGQGPVFLVFHDNNQDVKYLNELKADLNGLSYLLPDAMPEEGIFVVDTADLIGALLGEGSGGNNRGLEKTCALLQIKTDYLHNAGNDAHVRLVSCASPFFSDVFILNYLYMQYTLLAMESMANGDPIDAQREKRWPNQTVTGVQVSLKPWQEDSDYSDEEGIFDQIKPGQMGENAEHPETAAADVKAVIPEETKATKPATAPTV